MATQVVTNGLIHHWEASGCVKVNGVWKQAKSVWAKESTGWTEKSWDDVQTIFKTENVKA